MIIEFSGTTGAVEENSKKKTHKILVNTCLLIA
jgi:hypothetical protein